MSDDSKWVETITLSVKAFKERIDEAWTNGLAEGEARGEARGLERAAVEARQMSVHFEMYTCPECGLTGAADNGLATLRDLEARIRALALTPAEPVRSYEDGVRDGLATAAKLREAADEAMAEMKLCTTRDFDAPEDAEVGALGHRIGFGALMAAASKEWKRSLEATGWPSGGQHTTGPCFATVARTRKMLAAAMADYDRAMKAVPRG